MERYRTLAAHWRQRYGRKVRKVVLDAGLSCPNRDGTISRQGCAFCNPRGSGSGLAAKGLSLSAQWDAMAPRVLARHGTKAGPPLLVAYLQAFTNTHCTAERLAELLAETAALPHIGGLSIGTRPDCVQDEKLDCIAAWARPQSAPAAPSNAPARDERAPLSGHGLDPLMLELGLQSANDATLRRINRGHDAACLADAVRRAAERGLEVVVHVVAGLPGEGLDDLLATIDFVNGLPISGIKLHNLYVARDTAMARLWRSGQYAPPGLEEYAHWAAQALARLRADIVVHRLTGDPAPGDPAPGDSGEGELLAPDWASDKNAVLAAIRQRLEADGLRQGCLL